MYSNSFQSCQKVNLDKLSKLSQGSTRFCKRITGVFSVYLAVKIEKIYWVPSTVRTPPPILTTVLIFLEFWELYQNANFDAFKITQKPSSLAFLSVILGLMPSRSTLLYNSFFRQRYNYIFLVIFSKFSKYRGKTYLKNRTNFSRDTFRSFAFFRSFSRRFVGCFATSSEIKNSAHLKFVLKHRKTAWEYKRDRTDHQSSYESAQIKILIFLFSSQNKYEVNLWSFWVSLSQFAGKWNMG